jgi:hypothetical protein
VNQSSLQIPLDDLSLPFIIDSNRSTESLGKQSQKKICENI